MSGEKIGKVLKVNVPEFMQGMKHLDEYLDVAADIMGDVHTGIDELKTIKNYGECDAGMVDINLAEMGFEVPVNIKLSVKRKVLRDLAEIHLRGGTNDGLEHLLRIVGLDSELNRGWLLNSDMMRSGWNRDYFTRDTVRYTSNDRIYMDLLYGDVVEEDGGSFFKGHSYWDTDKEQETALIPIVGEVYDVNGTLGEDNVEATPYLIIRFEDDDIFLVDDVESVDPDTGRVFPYTVNERFTLLEDIIQFFLVGEYRPTTMRIIVEAKLLQMVESVAIAEKFKIQTIDIATAPHIDRYTIGDKMINKSTLSPLISVVGDPRIIVGTPTPIYSRWWGVALKVGIDNNTGIRMVESWSGLATAHHADQYAADILVPLLGEAEISTSGLPPHTLVGITEANVEVPINDGTIPTVYKAIKVRLTTTPTSKHMFTITRKRRDDE